jgi:hypothetical protein
MRPVDTFFRGYRRETFIDGAAILCNAAGEKRLKLSMKIPLTGDQLIGMPTWVSVAFEVIAKAENAGKSHSSSMELDPMILRVSLLPDAKTDAITFDGVRMCSFKIERDSDADKEHPDVVLTFTAYLPRTGKLLKFADDNFNSSMFIKYEAAQQSLLDDNPNVQPADAPPETKDEDEDKDDDDDEYEKVRKVAVSKEMDAEFGVVAGKKSKAKVKAPPPRSTKRDGYGKPIPSVQ